MSKIKILSSTLIAATALVISLTAQEPQAQKAPRVTVLPKASLWGHYSFQFVPTGDNGPYHWRVLSGALPPGLVLSPDGTLSGQVATQTASTFAVGEVDRTGKQEIRNCTLATETPLTADWEKHAQVSGNRIDGSIKVSNTTGRDFDLTFIVLAVNDIGRATAIGYQHFPLKQNTRGFELPFGETLPPGNYVVNIDVVGEEPQSKMIFRTRLVAKLGISSGP